MILKTTTWFIVVWALWSLVLIRIYSPEPVPVYFLQNNGAIQVDMEKFSRQLVESFAGKMGSELLRFNINILNNYQLAFESEKAEPKLSYSSSILTLSAKENIYDVDYQQRISLHGVFSEDEILTQVGIIGMKTKVSPQQIYGPNAQISMSAVGYVELVPTLSSFSKFNIGIFALISLFALINWLKGFFSFVRNGPKRYFFQD